MQLSNDHFLIIFSQHQFRLGCWTLPLAEEHVNILSKEKKAPQNLKLIPNMGFKTLKKRRLEGWERGDKINGFY